MESLAQIVLWLFVVNLGIAFGAGLYETRISVPQWLTPAEGGTYRWDPDAARKADVGLRFWVWVTTIPLTLLTLASLVLAWWTPDAVRGWWLIAVAASLVDRVMTFSYFVPTMIRLMRIEGPADSDAAAKARDWVNLGYVRQAATLVAWLSALQAFSLNARCGG